MSALYLRRARLEIGSVGIPFEASTGLRFSFHIQKNPYSNQPNTATISISNLSKKSRDLIASAFDSAAALATASAITDVVSPPSVRFRYPGLTQISIFAGYRGFASNPGTMGLIFSGHSLNVISTRNGADWETRIIAAEGILSRDVRLTKTFQAGTDFATIFSTMLDHVGSSFKNMDTSQALARVQKGDFKGAFDIVLKKAFSFEGSVMDKMNDYMRPQGFEISEQSGKIILLHIGETLSESAIKLNAGSGLIGTLTPVKDDKLPGVQIVKGRSLLRHEMQIGSALFLDSEVTKGFYKIRKLTTVGDTHGPAWHSQFEAIHTETLREI